MFGKTVLTLSAAVMLASASAALAHKRTVPRTTAPPAFGQLDGRAAFAQSPQLRGDGIVGDAVIRGGRIIGRDPDPNVRLQIFRDWRSSQ